MPHRGLWRAFACGWLALGGLAPPTAAALPPRFDGERALAIARELCAFGPRVPGTKAPAEARTYIAGARALCDQSARELPAAWSYPPGTALSCLVGAFVRQRRAAVLIGALGLAPLCRPGSDSTRRRQPVLGRTTRPALASCYISPVMHATRRRWESISCSSTARTADRAPDTYCLGSQGTSGASAPLPAYVINLDMVGGRTAAPDRGGYSQARAGGGGLVWETGRGARAPGVRARAGRDRVR
jgi:hypothetical protein